MVFQKSTDGDRLFTSTHTLYPHNSSFVASQVANMLSVGVAWLINSVSFKLISFPQEIRNVWGFVEADTDKMSYTDEEGVEQSWNWDGNGWISLAYCTKGAITIKKLCDGLEITLGEFFSTPEFDALEQEIS